MEAKERKPMSAFDLVTELERFISDNDRRSRDLEDRWLADELKKVLPIAREVRNNNLGPENRAKANAFRALEIEEELRAKQSEIERLERDLKKLKAA